METKYQELHDWMASMIRGDLGYVYIRLYANAPERIRDMAVNHFGRKTVFLPPMEVRPHAA